VAINSFLFFFMDMGSAGAYSSGAFFYAAGTNKGTLSPLSLDSRCVLIPMKKMLCILDFEVRGFV
jgi:hypothetical protein